MPGICRQPPGAAGINPRRLGKARGAGGSSGQRSAPGAGDTTIPSIKSAFELLGRRGVERGDRGNGREQRRRQRNETKQRGNGR
jgi:hypothetical protein